MDTEPTPPLLWQLTPEYIADGEAFSRMPLSAQGYVLSHWVWSMRHGRIWGRGLVAHHNWLKWCIEEDAAEAANPVVPGVSLDGVPIRRGDW